MKPFVDDPANATPERRKRAIHCLRFVIDAFPQRREACASFVQPLTMFVAKTLDESDDLLLTKLAVEAAGVLRPKQLSVLLVGALSKGDSWISDTAFRACQYVEAADPRLEQAVASHMQMLSHVATLVSAKQEIFSLSLCPMLNRVKRYANLLYWESVAIVCFLIALTIETVWRFFNPMQPLSWVGGFMGTAFFLGIFLVIETMSRSSPLRVSGVTISSRVPTRDVFTTGIIGGYAVGLISFLAGIIFTKVRTPPSMFLIAGSALMVILAPAFFYKSAFLTDKRPIRDVLARLYRSYDYLLFGAVLLVALRFLPPGITRVVGFVLFGLIGVVFVAIFVLSITFLVNLSRDGWQLRKYRRQTTFTRALLTTAFNSFHTTWGRENFVNLLIATEVRPTEDWPEGKAPNKNDNASTRLAQLEERWLGLDY